MRTYRVKIVVTAGDKGPDDYAETHLPTVQAESAKAVVEKYAARCETATEQHDRLVAAQNANAVPATPPGVAKA